MVKYDVSNYLRKLYVTPLYYSYGNAAEEILWAKARAMVDNSKVVIIPPARITQILGYRICNKELFKLKINSFEVKCNSIIFIIINIIFFLSRLVGILIKKILDINVGEKYFFPLIGKGKFWPNKNINKDFLELVKSDPINNQIHENLHIDLNSVQTKKAKFAIENYLDLTGKKFVCLHVRDSGFHGDADKRPYRNADIRTYVDAILYLIENGLSVVRLGDPSMPKLNLNIPGYIEYSHLDVKSELLDLALIRYCEFYIGMQSGPVDVALMFQKPVLLLNMYEWVNGLPQKITDRGLLKNIRVRGNPKYLTLEERFKLPFKYTNPMIKFKNEEIEFISNTNEEILNATKDYFTNFINKMLDQPSDYLVLKKMLFKECSEKYFREIIGNNINIFHPDEYELSRMMYKNIACKGFYYNA